jgi:hypothetical protein
MKRALGLIVLALASLILYVGCSGSSGQQDQQADKTSKATKDQSPAEAKGDHEHKPGSRGGRIVAIGRDNYHAEAVFAKDGIVKIYTLGRDESRVLEVELQTLEAYARAEGANEDLEVDLHPLRQRGDSPGKTSVFRGKLPGDLWGKTVTLTVPITINGERFRFPIASKPADHEDDPMPEKVAGEKEKELYLMPGGKYTIADIAANGNMTASQKFKGLKSLHGAAKPGDKICPISNSKASSKFTWVVDGQPYEFCCPPCVDEFVQKAKDEPAKIEPAKTYVKQ